MPEPITITLPILLLTGDTGPDEKHELAAWIGQHPKPPKPVGHSTITVTRMSSGQPTDAAMRRSTTYLLDVLKPRTQHRPWGQGYVEDVNHIVHCVHRSARRGTSSTKITIAPL